MKILMKSYLLGVLIFLTITTAECFVVFGGARCSVPQIRNGGCCSGRRLHYAYGHITAPEAPRCKLMSLSPTGADERRTVVYRSGLIASSRVHEGVRLLATVDNQIGGDFDRDRMDGGEEEDAGFMAGKGGLDEGQGAGGSGEALDQKKEAGYLENVEAAYLRDMKSEDGDLLEGLDEDDRIAMELAPDADGREYEGLKDDVYNEGMEVGHKGVENQEATWDSDEKQEDELAGKSDYFIPISDKDFFGDLVPIEEYQPTAFPDDAMYSREELMNANLSCAQNPFDDSSFYVDRDIKMGVIDEKKREAIQPMMRVVEQVCELIDTSDDVFSFKYTGLIVNKRGIEAWTKKLVKDNYPEVKDVKLVTNRTRDKRDY